MQIWTYTLLSVFIVSAVSLVGIFALPWKNESIRKALVFFVSFAAGTLLGDAFLHLIPEAFENGQIDISLLILLGFLIFFVLEKIIHWRHCHDENCDRHIHILPRVIFFGDAIHNLIDGIIIAASFLVSIPVGIATTIAVVLHEIPQEIGDFGSFLYAGFTKTKALAYNFISALSAVAGAVAVLVLSENIKNIADFLIPVAAGGFIYIASSDMIPELHKHSGKNVKHSLLQLIFMCMGIAMMVALLLLE